MSAASIRRFNEHQREKGKRPLVARLSNRDVAKRLREHAARLLADAAEHEAMADYLGEPEC